MASSSVSQDDVDNNFEKNSRRSRIRTARARQINPSGCRVESQSVFDGDECGTSNNVQSVGEEATRHIAVSAPGDPPLQGSVEHETSPKQILRSTKDISSTKRPNKPPHHVNKGKQQRDRRKLREKRRSTGVVHLASTESTGGSTTGDDEESSDAGAINATTGCSLTAETRKNTLQNETLTNCYDDHFLSTTSNFRVQHSSSDVSNGGSVLYHHHHRGCASSSSGICGGTSLRRNKSPSDLEADDENDHDSLNQSEGSCSQLVSALTGLKGCKSSSHTATSTDGIEDQVRRVVEENQRLISLVEEKDRRIHLLEFKVQQLMRDTLTISEEQSRLQKENSTLLRALSKLTSERNAHRKSQPQPQPSNGEEPAS